MRRRGGRRSARLPAAKPTTRSRPSRRPSGRPRASVTVHQRRTPACPPKPSPRRRPVPTCGTGAHADEPGSPDKVAVVTGAGKGIGSAIVETLGREDARVAAGIRTRTPELAAPKRHRSRCRGPAGVPPPGHPRSGRRTCRPARWP
ncbi:SDR family NAD(P)-dependent oxidoreductase [Streptomyces sp. NPDC056716]|uniref:SDR family NAD(P)-dependent oxidoreductase n=1 Tax=unclassified Streptomyces TaxID=2593676 RepID=UPI0036976DD8